MVSLFTSIPIPDVLQIVSDLLLNDNFLSERTKLFFQDIMEALKLCLHSTIFSFNSVFYRQTFGTPVGSCISPVIANIFMESVERSAIDSFQKTLRVWVRYVDDIFCVIKVSFIDDFLHHINGILPTIKFTVEIEENCSLAFLDVKVSRNLDNTLWTNIYQKPTHRNRYLRVLNGVGVKVALKPLLTIGKFLPSLKDPLVAEEKSCLVYEVPCKDCSFIYIEQTKRDLKSRVCEHQTAIKFQRPEKSALREHSISLNHTINWSEVEILKTETNYSKRLFAES